MNKYKEIFDSIFMGGIIGGFATFILNLITISFWQRDGFDFLEIALMTIMAGLFLFISTLNFPRLTLMYAITTFPLSK